MQYPQIRLIFIVALIGVFSCANAQDATYSEFVPVGVSTLETTGGGGFHQNSNLYLFGAQTRHRHCQSAYGATARMCTSRDVLQAPSEAFGITGWIAPAGIGVFHTGKGTRFFDTASGVTAPGAGRLSCDQHLRERDPNGNGKKKTGLILSDRGEITLSACEELRPVVCCARVEQPMR